MIEVGDVIERGGFAYTVRHVGKVSRSVAAKGIERSITCTRGNEKTLFQGWIYDNGEVGRIWSVA